MSLVYFVTYVPGSYLRVGPIVSQRICRNSDRFIFGPSTFGVGYDYNRWFFQRFVLRIIGTEFGGAHGFEIRS